MLAESTLCGALARKYSPKLWAAPYLLRALAGRSPAPAPSQAESLEKKEAQLSEVLAASNLDPTMLGAVTRKLDDVLDAKNGALKSLQYELDRVTKAHNDVIRVYESKLTEFGIPVEELGFRPLVTNTGTGPAGLVAS